MLFLFLLKLRYRQSHRQLRSKAPLLAAAAAAAAAAAEAAAETAAASEAAIKIDTFLSCLSLFKVEKGFVVGRIQLRKGPN